VRGQALSGARENRCSIPLTPLLDIFVPIRGPSGRSSRFGKFHLLHRPLKHEQLFSYLLDAIDDLSNR